MLQHIKIDVLSERYSDDNVKTTFIVVQAEKICGPNGHGPPSNGGWLTTLAQKIKHSPAVKQVLQQGGTDQRGERTTKKKGEYLGMSSFSDLFWVSANRRSVKADCQRSTERLRPLGARTGNFEAMRRLAQQTRPGNARLIPRTLLRGTQCQTCISAFESNLHLLESGVSNPILQRVLNLLATHSDVLLPALAAAALLNIPEDNSFIF